MTVPIFTASWRTAYDARNDDPHTFVPVRISLGLPRYWPAARNLPVVRALAPSGLFHVNDRDEFEPAYVERRLEKAGVPLLAATFDAIYESYQLPLALVCFEDARKTWCHRHTFAAWWEQQTGQAIPELDHDPTQATFYIEDHSR